MQLQIVHYHQDEAYQLFEVQALYTAHVAGMHCTVSTVGVEVVRPLQQDANELQEKAYGPNK